MPDQQARSAQIDDREATILVLSGQEDQTIREDFIQSGAKRYISKDDYFIDTLIDTIEDEMHMESD